MGRMLAVVAIAVWCSLAVSVGAAPPGNDETQFQAEMRLAAAATDRDSRVKHWKAAISYRPDDLGNITIEYKIAVALSQVTDPTHKQGLHRDEGLEMFKKIVSSYDHMRYYSQNPSDSIESAQFMVPRAAVHAASLLWGGLDAPEDARKYLKLAMKDIEATYRKRIEDWSQPHPQPRIDPFSGEDKVKARLEFWLKRQDAATRGEVLSSHEMVVVKEAVRQFGYSYGKLAPHELADVMRQVAKDFPDTPMAQEAEKQIDELKKLTLSRGDKRVHNLGSSSAPAQSQPSSRKLPSAPQVTSQSASEPAS